MNLRKPLEKFFSQTRVQRQLTSVFFLTLLIPIACIGFLLLFNSRQTLFNHYQEQSESDSLRVRSIMFDLTTNFYNISENISSDSALLAILDTVWGSPDQARIMAEGYNQITSIRQQDTSIGSIAIYTSNESVSSYGDFLPITEEIQKTAWFSKASSTAGIFWQTLKREDTLGNTYWELNMFRQIPLPKSRSYAILAITASNNYLKNRIDNSTLRNIITVNQDPSFYSTSRTYSGEPFPLELDYDKYTYTDAGVLSLNGHSVMASVNTLRPYKSDDKIYIASYNPNALDEIHQIQTNYTLIMVFAILIPCLLIYLFIRYFSARVNTLRSAMHQASHGDYNIIDSFHGNDELSETFRDLQTMIQEIKQKEALVYQAQIREQKLENQQQQMEYKMLASQINPHFLYNTLETIRMKAFAAGNREVAMAIKLLGKSLRYVLDNTGTVSTTLAKEFDYLKIYFSIQQLRFGDRIQYQIEVQDGLDLENYQILPLLLQPIVENAISHGLENVEENGLVLLKIYEQNDTCLCIDISDNGIGMTEKELIQLRKNISEKDTSRTQSIGLYNINQRIQLCYGPEYSLSVASSRGKGTTVSLKLPLNKL